MQLARILEIVTEAPKALPLSLGRAQGDVLSGAVTLWVAPGNPSYQEGDTIYLVDCDSGYFAVATVRYVRRVAFSQMAADEIDATGYGSRGALQSALARAHGADLVSDQTMVTIIAWRNARSTVSQNEQDEFLVGGDVWGDTFGLEI